MRERIGTEETRAKEDGHIYLRGIEQEVTKEERMTEERMTEERTKEDEGGEDERGDA